MGRRRGACGGAFYLLLSGAEVATQRTFFMTAVVLIAVMVDRRAVTFRMLAVAAMIVLVLAPEASVHPSFQSLSPQGLILPVFWILRFFVCVFSKRRPITT
jgi:predicted membrane metal-binding protein